MKPASFDYYRPGSLQEALHLLAECGEEGKVLAGGQSLVPILNMRLSAPACLVDINGLRELDYVRIEDGTLRIGALTRQRTIENSVDVRAHAPLLAEAVPYIGHVQTRNRGTVGGSLVHSDPTAELPLSLLALSATAVVQSAEETREVPLDEFFITYLTTDVSPEELLTEVRVPLANVPSGFAFAEYSRRHGDFALVDAGCLIGVDDAHRIETVRLVLGGVDAVPVLVEDAADVLVGETPSEVALAEVARRVVDVIDPEEDIHGSREYRQHLAGVFAKKALERAYARAVGEGEPA